MAVTWKKLAFEDDVAVLSDASPASVGTSASAGAAGSASRSDHVHDLGADCIDSGDLIADDILDSEHYVAQSIDTEHIALDAIDATLIADDAVGSEHIEPLDAALDVNGQQMNDMVLENNSGTIAPAVIGKIYYDTGESAAYICTADS